MNKQNMYDELSKLLSEYMEGHDKYMNGDRKSIQNEGEKKAQKAIVSAKKLFEANTELYEYLDKEWTGTFSFQHFEWDMKNI